MRRQRRANNESEENETMTKQQVQSMALTAEDEALIVGVQERDLAPPAPKLIALLQHNSTKMLEKIKGSKAGDYGVPADGEYLLFKAAAGVPHIPIGFERWYVEWAANRGGYVDKHPKKPSDARWLKANESPDRKQGFWRDNGNKLEDTVFAHLLIVPDNKRPPWGATFAYRSTSLNIGLDFENQAERIKVENTKLGGAIVGKWRMTSRIERDGDFSWFVPVMTLEGKLHEERGPSIDQMRLAAQLRQAFKQGLQQPEKIAAPQNVTPIRGRITIESGRKPAPAIDPNEEIPF
jgi:hypothetical protein